VLPPRGHLQRGHVELEHEVGEAIEEVPAQPSSRSERNHWLRFRYVSIHPIVGAYLMINHYIGAYHCCARYEPFGARQLNSGRAAIEMTMEWIDSQSRCDILLAGADHAA
jgi:hypothetical protein